ncbi:MAG: uncharacterized membrane protein YkvA (DUF1232 family) [Litorivivens sp.]|jgi:uncharacterized membrane protein YkvA (DUF1232 family)
MRSMQRFKTWVRALKCDVMMLWFTLKQPDTPWYARALAAVITAYAFSPIDLIPGFIPVLGYLDDLTIVPAGVWMILRILSEKVVIDSRAESDKWFLEQK